MHVSRTLPRLAAFAGASVVLMVGHAGVVQASGPDGHGAERGSQASAQTQPSQAQPSQAQASQPQAAQPAGPATPAERAEPASPSSGQSAQPATPAEPAQASGGRAQGGGSSTGAQAGTTGGDPAANDHGQSHADGAAHDGGSSHGQSHADEARGSEQRNGAAGDAQGPKAGNAQGPKAGNAQGPKAGNGPKAGQQSNSDRGNGHTPVTVCHLLGNGSYILLTFDENALKAHEAHGDLYPVPEDGCPDLSTAPDAEGTGTVATPASGNDPGTGASGGDTGTDVASGGAIAGDQPDDQEADGTVQGGAQEDEPSGEAVTSGEVAAGAVSDDVEVLGVEAVRGDAAVAEPEERLVAGGPLSPVAGILPATGAGAFGLVLLAGALLLGAGGVVLARSRRTAGR